MEQTNTQLNKIDIIILKIDQNSSKLLHNPNIVAILPEELTLPKDNELWVLKINVEPQDFNKIATQLVESLLNLEPKLSGHLIVTNNDFTIEKLTEKEFNNLGYYKK